MAASSIHGQPLLVVPHGMDIDLRRVEYVKRAVSLETKQMLRAIKLNEFICRVLLTVGLILAIGIPLTGSAYAMNQVDNSFTSISYMKNQSVPSLGD